MNSPRESFEIIAVDNNSDDGSMAILKRYPVVKILSESKPGAYAARNTGMQAACGEILAFTDPDCLVSPDWLRVIDDQLRDPSARVLLGCRQSIRESVGLALRKVKAGGIIAGDDYATGGWWQGGVKKAVDEFGWQRGVKLLWISRRQFLFRRVDVVKSPCIKADQRVHGSVL